MIELTRRYAFPAAHVLRSESLDERENERIFGKCANPNGHGHNYGVEVTVSGRVEPVSGQILPPSELDRIFEQVVMEPFSHRMLNEASAFNGIVPTAENIALVLQELLAPEIERRTNAELSRVRVIETSRNSCEVGEFR